MIAVFVDTETTGVHRGYRPWDIALIRREPDGTHTETTIFVDVDDLDLDNADPAALEIGRFEQRHPQRGGDLGPGDILLSGDEAAQEVSLFTAGAQLFGVNTWFDFTGLDGLLARHNLDASWFYVPGDLLGLAYGFLRGQGVANPPRSSERLSLACGVPVPAADERHTAMGDARWAARWYAEIVDGCPQ